MMQTDEIRTPDENARALLTAAVIGDDNTLCDLAAHVVSTASAGDIEDTIAFLAIIAGLTLNGTPGFEISALQTIAVRIAQAKTLEEV